LSLTLCACAYSESVREPAHLVLLLHAWPACLRPSNLQREYLLAYLRPHDHANGANAENSQASYLRLSLENQAPDSEFLELGDSTSSGWQGYLRVGEDPDVRCPNESTNRDSFRECLIQYRSAPPKAILSSSPPAGRVEPRSPSHSSRSPCLSWGNHPSWRFRPSPFASRSHSAGLRPCSAGFAAVPPPPPRRVWLASISPP